MPHSKCSVIFEYAAFDGITTWQFTGAIRGLVFNYKPESVAPRAPQNWDITIEELIFESTPTLDNRMMAVRTSYKEATALAEYRNYIIPHFGSSNLMA